MSKKETKHKSRYRMKKLSMKWREKIRNRVKDCHHKLAKYLCENYNVILIPSFETQKMVKRGHRKINSKTALSMLTWSHYLFRQRLISKSERYPWCKVLVTTEEYTSKTCGECGNIHRGLGSNKTFTCPYFNCGTIMDRDINAARFYLDYY